jgi:hypothetical protein
MREAREKKKKAEQREKKKAAQKEKKKSEQEVFLPIFFCQNIYIFYFTNVVFISGSLHEIEE